MKKHDENKDVMFVSRRCQVDTINKTIKANKNQCIGIHMWGRIDFLTHYCGYLFLWDNTVSTVINKQGKDDSQKEENKEEKQNKVRKFNKSAK